MAKNLYNQLPLYGLDKLSRPQKNVVKDLLWMCTEDNLEYYHTGSRLVKDIEWGDVDFVVKVDDVEKYKKYLEKEDWEEGGSDTPEQDFTSYKKLNINIILTSENTFFDNWVAASNIVSTYQIKAKYNRIKVFGYVFKREGFTVTHFEEAISNKEEDRYHACPF